MKELFIVTAIVFSMLFIYSPLNAGGIVSRIKSENKHSTRAIKIPTDINTTKIHGLHKFKGLKKNTEVKKRRFSRLNRLKRFSSLKRKSKFRNCIK